MTADELIRRYQVAYGRLTLAAVARVAALWQAAGDLDGRRFTGAAVRHMAGAELAVARLVAGYLAALGRVVTGTGKEAAVAADKVTGKALRGVEPDVVWHRPVVTARTAIAQGKPFAEAMALGLLRARQLAQADVMLAQRAATLEVVANDQRIVGYRRVLTGKSCMFCATAATKRYHVAELAPLHGGCDCSVAAVWGDVDPGKVVNQRLLDTLKARGSDYWKQRGFVDRDGNPIPPDEAPVEVRQHGEYGPVLVDRHDSFSGPEVAA